MCVRTTVRTLKNCVWQEAVFRAAIIEAFIAAWKLLLHCQAKCYVISEFSDVGHETSSAKESNRIGFLTLSFHLKKETA
jgi:hypothetical protein